MTDRSKPLKGWAGPVMSDSHEGDEVCGLWPVLAFSAKDERDAHDEAQREIGRQEERARLEAELRAIANGIENTIVNASELAVRRLIGFCRTLKEPDHD